MDKRRSVVVQGNEVGVAMTTRRNSVRFRTADGREMKNSAVGSMTRIQGDSEKKTGNGTTTSTPGGSQTTVLKVLSRVR